MARDYGLRSECGPSRTDHHEGGSRVSVRSVGVEPTRLAALAPQTSVSAIPPRAHEERSGTTDQSRRTQRNPSRLRTLRSLGNASGTLDGDRTRKLRLERAVALPIFAYQGME